MFAPVVSSPRDGAASTSPRLKRLFGWGFFGQKLYYEDHPYKNAATALTLSVMYPEQAPELRFKNPVLAAFSVDCRRASLASAIGSSPAAGRCKSWWLFPVGARRDPHGLLMA